MQGFVVLKQLSGAVVIISMCIGSNIAWPDRTAGPSAPETKINFDQVFADAAWPGQFNPLMGGMAIERDKKSDRPPARKKILLERARLPNCEPVAARYADPGLGRFVGRCFA